MLKCSSLQLKASGRDVEKDSIFFKGAAHWEFDQAPMNIGGRVVMGGMGSNCD